VGYFKVFCGNTQNFSQDCISPLEFRTRDLPDTSSGVITILNKSQFRWGPSLKSNLHVTLEREGR
jgi:hypothetical protein